MQTLPSVFDATSLDLGGIYARQGFAYQDDVAAKFYIEMLSDDNLLDVSCETHDDILLIWKSNGSQIAEFVQVKAEHPDQLWSVAKLCEKIKPATNPMGVGTSILEKNLARDQYLQPSWFRIVTCRQIHPDLEVLTRGRGHEHRSLSYEPFNGLAAQVKAKIGEFMSKKENDALYWLTNACWDVISEIEIGTLNQKALTDILHSIGEPYDPDTVRSIYNNLRTLAKETAEFGVDRWNHKHISRDQLLAKIKDWIQPYPGRVKTERLEKKLTDSGLDSTCREVAKDQQRFYLKKKRTAPYLTTEKAENIEHEVLDVLHNLRSSLDSGVLDESGIDFHERCLKAVGKISGVQEDGTAALPSGYLSGCMYEITARCRHRFMRFQS